MNDLSPRAKHLIELARSVDGPERDRLAKLRAGITAAVAAGTLSEAAKAALASSRALTAASGAAGKVAVLGATKSVGVVATSAGAFALGATVGALLMVSTQYLSGSSTPPQKTPVRAAARTEPRLSSRPTPAVAAPVRAEPVASTGTTSPAVPLRRAPAPARVDSVTLAQETRLLDEAQLALQSSNPARALSLIDEYERRFGRGVLAMEARAARVLALCRSGQIAQGRTTAAQFEADYPHSPLLRRVQRSCDAAEAPGAAQNGDE